MENSARWYVGLSIFLTIVVTAGVIGVATLPRGAHNAQPPNSSSVNPQQSPDPAPTYTFPTPTSATPIETPSEPSSSPDEPEPSITTRPTTPAPDDGDNVVTATAEASQHADAPAVVRLLTDYFTSINERDYTRYRLLHTKSERAKLSRAHFLEGYRSTHDTDIVLQKIKSATDGRLLITVSFVSQQDSADGPDGQTCTRWTTTRALEADGSELRIGRSPKNNTTFVAC